MVRLRKPKIFMIECMDFVVDIRMQLQIIMHL